MKKVVVAFGLGLAVIPAILFILALSIDERIWDGPH